MNYELIDLEQGTNEWLAFRRDHIGSSDASVIKGINPWKTPHTLWQQKTEGVEDEVNNAMRKGLQLEPMARQLFTEHTGISVRPVVVRNRERPWQMASLDGMSESGDLIVEIKCGSEDLYKKALDGIIPEYYMCQLQHEHSVCSPKKAYYGCFYEDNLAILEVQRDEAFIADLNSDEEKFWNFLREREPPPLSERDYERIEHLRGSELLQEYFLLAEQEKSIKKRKDAIKEDLIEIGPKRNFILDGTKVYQTQSTSYDFKRMKEEGINLEDYKKKSSPFWIISNGSRPRASV